MITHQTDLPNHLEKNMNSMQTEQTGGAVCTIKNECINCGS